MRVVRPRAITPNTQNIIITFNYFLLRIPRTMGLTVDAKVPTAETIPIPKPEILEGYI